MKAGPIIAGVLLLLAIGACGFGFGVAYESRVSAQAIGDAKGKQQSASEDAQQARAALAEVQQSLGRQKADLDQARQIAAIALDQRDAAQADLAQLTQQRTEALRTAARESPDCVDLAHLPICPAVAERLFAPTNNPASGSH